MAESQAYADLGYAIARARIAYWISEQRESVLGRFESTSNSGRRQETKRKETTGKKVTKHSGPQEVAISSYTHK